MTENLGRSLHYSVCFGTFSLPLLVCFILLRSSNTFSQPTFSGVLSKVLAKKDLINSFTLINDDKAA